MNGDETRTIAVDVDGRVLEFEAPATSVVLTAVVGVLIQHFDEDGESWTMTAWRATPGPAATRVGLSRMMAASIEADAMVDER